MTVQALGVQISNFLKGRGVEVIFGIPGVHNQELYRGVSESGLTHVLARHEQGAGFMADGYARASGKPGLAYVITGPGLCNIMTPMGQSYSDSIPLLVISTCLDNTESRFGQLHQMRDQEGAARAVCDWSETAISFEAAYGLLERAFDEFASKRPRPKHIQVPISLLRGYAPDFRMQRPVLTSFAQDEEAISDVVSRLLSAKRPLFIVGGGAVKADIMPLLERCDAAVFSTFAGRGLVPPTYPLYMGSFLSRPDSAAIIATADLVIVLGSELAEVDLWRTHLGHKAIMVRVDIDPAVLNDAQKAEIRICMKVEDLVQSLLGRLNSGRANSSWTGSVIQQNKKDWTRQASANYPGILPAIWALKDAIPDNAMVYSDMTQFAYLAKEVWDMAKPSRWHHPYGFGTLGYALPAAIGGCIAQPNLPVFAIAGDYGFQYTLAELGVAVELGLSLPIVIWNNEKLKAVEDSMISSQILPNAVKARNPDFLAIARAYGAYAKRPNTRKELKDNLAEAFCAGKPTLVCLCYDTVMF